MSGEACPECAASLNYVASEERWFCNRCADWREAPAPSTAIAATTGQQSAKTSLLQTDGKTMMVPISLGHILIELVVVLIGAGFVVTGYTITGGIIILIAAFGLLLPI